MAAFTKALAHPIEDEGGKQRAVIDHHVGPGKGDRPLPGGRKFPDGRHEHGGSQRLADRQGEQSKRDGKPGRTGKHHDGPAEDANPNADEKCLPQPDGVGQRADQQGDDGHRDRPHGHETQSLLIAVAEIGGKPAFQRQVGDGVGGEAEQFDRKCEPQLARRAVEAG